jgi:TRAP-type C4-dicarboxylate transport system substrate-binding protein
LTALAAVGTSASARDFRTSDIYPPESPTVQAQAYMGTIVERRSYGRLKVKVSAEGDRDSENFTIAQVRTGALDMARVSLAALNSSVPSTALLSAPFILNSSLQTQRVLEGEIGAEILADLEKHDLIGLCFYDAGARSIYTVDKPVRTLADTRGLRVRAQPGDLASNFWREFGAVPLAFPYSRIADGLRTHALDAATGNWQSFVFGGHYRSVKFFTPSEHARPPGVLIFSRQVWKELPEVDREILTLAARESAVHQRQLLEAFEVQARRTVEAAGVTILDDFDKKSFRDPMEQLYLKLYPEPQQQRLLKRIQAAAGGS